MAHSFTRPARRLLLPGLLVLALPLFFLSGDQMGWRIPRALFAFGHAIYFGLLAFLVANAPALRRYAFGVRALLALLAVAVISAGTELIQPHFGREASWGDLLVNMAGAVAALSLCAPRRSVRRLQGAASIALLIMVLYQPSVDLWDWVTARRQFPVLSDFETAFEHRRWSRGTPDASLAHSGQRSLRVALPPGRYPGTTLRRHLGDWRGYDALRLSVHNPGPGALRVTVSIRDREHFRRGTAHHDRFNQRFHLEPGWNTLNIPLDRVRNAPRDRTLNLDAVAELLVFTVNLTRPLTLHVDNVRLIRQSHRPTESSRADRDNSAASN